jgi:hypothetical protein
MLCYLIVPVETVQQTSKSLPAFLPSRQNIANGPTQIVVKTIVEGS